MKKILTLMIIIFLILTSLPIISGEANNNTIKKMSAGSDNETEYYAIIAACTEYNDPKLNLPRFTPPHAEWKLKTIYNTLIDAENWDEENIILLINEQVTIENLNNAFDEMADVVDENDVFLFSWQGHGSQVPDLSTIEYPEFDEEDEYDEVMDPYNCYRDEDGVLHNYITDDELNDKFSSINSKGQFIIFDCCYSGGIINDLDDGQRVMVALTEEDNVGLIDLFIGFPMTISLSFGLEHDSFKRIKDKNKDGYLSAEEVFSFSKPVINIATRSWLIESFLITYMIKDIVPRTGPFSQLVTLFMTIFSTGLGYLISQALIYSKSGDFAKNSPHMIDNFDGELDIIQLKN